MKKNAVGIGQIQTPEERKKSAARKLEREIKAMEAKILQGYEQMLDKIPKKESTDPAPKRRKQPVKL